MLAIAQADALFGEWEEDIIRFKSRQDEEENTASDSAIKLLSAMMSGSKVQTKFWEAGLDREVYGGTAFKIGFNLAIPWPHIEISKLSPDGFYPVWNPDDIDDLLEVWMVSKITKEQAFQLYGIKTDEDYVPRVEYWNKKKYEFWVGGKRIDAFSGVNPYGLVPFVYIPRLRTSHWYGDAITPEIISVQDELNMRVADIGEALNYNSHPIRYGTNLPRNFNADNYPLGPRAMWDLGRVIGNSTEPKVGLLEADNPIPERSLDFIKFIYDWSRTSAFAPPIAFGEDPGGGQRSGRTLEIRMWPLLRATRRSRGYMGNGIRRMCFIAARILQQKNLDSVSSHALTRIIDGIIVPDFWPIMPKDEAAIVDRVVKLMSTPVPTISLETATTVLGYGPTEVERITTMLADKLLGGFFENKDKEEKKKEVSE